MTDPAESRQLAAQFWQTVLLPLASGQFEDHLNYLLLIFILTLKLAKTLEGKPVAAFFKKRAFPRCRVKLAKYLMHYSTASVILFFCKEIIFF